MPIVTETFRTVSDFQQQTGINPTTLPQFFRLLAHPSRISSNSNSANKPLYIDGITSAGKTTLLRNLGEVYPEAKFIPEFFGANLPSKYNNVSPSSRLVDQLRAEYWFYHQYKKVNNYLKSLDHPAVVDRCLLGLFAYSNLLGNELEVTSRIIHTASRQTWVHGLYIFLTAQPEVIKQRLIQREDQAQIDETDWEAGVGQFIQALYQSVNTLAENANISLIDTSHLTPTQVVDQVTNLYEDFLAQL